MKRFDAGETTGTAQGAQQTMGQPCIGRPIQRIEDAAVLTGRGRYADSLGIKPGTLHTVILRSPHAHTELGPIDFTAALKAPGVRAVLTGTDLSAWSKFFVVGIRAPVEQWALAVDHVRYVSEPVVVVMTESRTLAEDTLDLVRVDYRMLLPMAPIETTVADTIPQLHSGLGSNVANDRHFRYGDPEAAFTTVLHRVSLTVHCPRNTCTPVECDVIIAEHLLGNEGYQVTSNFMGPFSLYAVMTMALQMSADHLHYIAPHDPGDSFGVKQAIFPYVVLMCLALHKAGTPVKWVEDRLEHLGTAASATTYLSTIEATVEAGDRIVALDYSQLGDCSGYLRAPRPATFYRVHGVLVDAYAVPNLRVRSHVMLANRTPTGLIRGFGGPQVYLALGRLVQRISIELNPNPLDVYRHNFVLSNAFPYRAAAGALLDSGNYQLAMSRALGTDAYNELKRRRGIARAEGRLYSIDFAAIVEPSVSNMGYITTATPAEARRKAGPKNGAIAGAAVSVDLLGGMVMTITSTPTRQDHVTVYAQVVAGVLGIDPAEVIVNIEFDTRKDAWSVAAGGYSSRFTGTVAGTVHLTTARIRDKPARIMVSQLDCDPTELIFAEGRITRRGTPETAMAFARATSNMPHWSPQLPPAGEEPGLREAVFWSPPNLNTPDERDRIDTSAYYGLALDLCGLEIDRATRCVRIDHYVIAHDAGKLLNPALTDGQIHGAFAQGLSAALMEELRYGPDDSFQSGTLADYLLSTTCEVPDPMIVHLKTPSPFTPLGARGLGGGNNMSTPPCTVNAAADALGVWDIRLPLTPAKVMVIVGLEDPPSSHLELAEAATAIATGGKERLKGTKTLSTRGTVGLDAPPEAIFAVLPDPQALAQAIPGCHVLEPTGDNRYRTSVTVGVDMIKVRYKAEIALSDLEPPHRLRLSEADLSSLGSARSSGMVELAPYEDGTRLTYDYETEISGEVVVVGGRMLEDAVKAVPRQLFGSLGRQAGGKPVRKPGWIARLLAFSGARR